MKKIGYVVPKIISIRAQQTLHFFIIVYYLPTSTTHAENVDHRNKIFESSWRKQSEENLNKQLGLSWEGKIMSISNVGMLCYKAWPAYRRNSENLHQILSRCPVGSHLLCLIIIIELQSSIFISLAKNKFFVPEITETVTFWSSWRSGKIYKG